MCYFQEKALLPQPLPSGTMTRIRHLCALMSAVLLLCATLITPSYAASRKLIALGSSTPSASPSVASVPASFTFNGAGFGHGIGLSQYGAQGMAKDGYTSDQIVKHYYPGTAVTKKPMPTDLVVGLLQEYSPVNRKFIALRSEGVGENGNPLTIIVGANRLTIPAKSNVTFGVMNNQVVIYGKGGIFQDSNKKALAASSVSVSWGKQKQGTKTATVVNVSAGITSAGAIANLGNACTSRSCNHRFKYGTLTIKPYTSSTLNVANTLSLDDEYLYGLGEVPSSWEPAALEAQVIAARSYAYSKYTNNKTMRSSCACQIYGTPADQNFVGFTKEISSSGSRWVSAVKNSSQKVVTYQGRIIQAFFSSSTGGYSQPVNEVWGSSGYPWLTKVDDHWSTTSLNPNASWTKTITQATLVSKLRKLGIPVKDVAAFVVTGNYESGGISEMTVADSAGRITVITSIPVLLRPTGPNISPEGMRSVFSLKSSYIRSISASSAKVSGAANNKPDVLTSVNISKWPALVQYPLTDLKVSGSIFPKQLGVKVQMSTQILGKWKLVGFTTTNLDGKWAMTWPKVNGGKYILRITAINSAGSVRVSSPIITLQGNTSLVGPKSVRPESRVYLSGDIRPVSAAVTVTIQRKLTNGSWKTLGKTFTDSTGHFVCNTKVSKRKGKVLYRVIANDDQLGTIVSKSITITVN